MSVFGPLFVPEELRRAVDATAWVAAMLEAEAALARAESAAGVVPVEAAAAIGERCRVELFDPGRLFEQGRASGNPVEPLVRALEEAVGGDSAGYVHWGATSQDVLDTAAMLVVRRALGPILAELDGAAAGCAQHAETHRATPMAARTLLQHAVPTTFGAKAAGWLVALVEARRRLAGIGLPVQLGGAAGTLASLGDAGPDVLRLFAQELSLEEPPVPWHTSRGRVAALGAALDQAAGAAAKIALDVALLAQTEVGEVTEGSTGGSSTMPQKRNPVGSTLAAACARLVRGYASVLSASVVQEHERAVGAWQAEWEALSGALAYAGGAAAAIRGVVEGLEVDTARMARNLSATGGLIVAERLSFLLAPRLGRREAHRLVAEAVSSGRPLRDELLARGLLTSEELDEALDPAGYLGSTSLFVDRALALWRDEDG